MMWRWACSAYLWALLAIPLLGWWVCRYRAPIVHPCTQVADLPLSCGPRYPLPSLVGLLALACFVLALARPQTYVTLPAAAGKGVDILLALDVSSSMLALDFSPSHTPYTRLEAVKDAIQGFIRQRPQDNLGLVAFAGASCAVSPLTTQHPWLLQRLSAVQVGFLPDGTAPGDALGSCLNRLRAAQDLHQPHGQILILMSDGVHNCGAVAPLVAAQALRDHGIKVYTIGVGQGGLVPTLHLDAHGNLARNAFGQLDVVKAHIPTDESTLQAIARITEGRFFRATHPEELQAIYQIIHTLYPRALPAPAVQVQREWMAWPLALGMGLLGLEQYLKCKRYFQV